jgi:hypothetical protein
MYSREKYLENREKILAQSKDYYHRNREKVLARLKDKYDPDRQRERNRAHYALNRNEILKRARESYTAEYGRAKKHGLSHDKFDSLLAAQGGVCPICLRDFVGQRVCVDHDHSCCSGSRSCGKCIRGLLCHSCNVTLGLMKDNPEDLDRAADYLRVHQSQISKAA